MEQLDPAASAAPAGHDLVDTVAVEVGSQQGVTLLERLVEHLPLPEAAVFAGRVHDDLMAVPRLDGRQQHPLRPQPTGTISLLPRAAPGALLTGGAPGAMWTFCQRPCFQSKRWMPSKLAVRIEARPSPSRSPT